MSPHSLGQNWRRSRHPVGEPAAARPILYSFRRCPYAIRARLALAAAGLAVELRELALACKPPELLEASAKATVPVLVLGADDPGLAPPWAEPTPWRSPRWLYHLALPEEWAEAQSQGEYRRSSRGLSLEQVGFIHASYAHQLAFTHRLYYADLPRVLLLTIAPQRLAAAGVVVQAEPAAGGQELFPHLYGALPLAAVVAVENWRPAGVPQAVAA